MSDWLNEVEGQLGERTETVREALDDLAAICQTAEAMWVHLGAAGAVTVLVLDDGSLHRIEGELDPEPTRPETESKRSCRYEFAPITSDASYTLKVTSTKGLNNTGGITHEWVFSGVFERSLEFQVSTEKPPKVDPTSFVRALAAEIARISARSRGDAR